MKRFICIFLSIVMLMCMFASCGNPDTMTHLGSADEDPSTKLSFVAEFYDNYGEQWLSVEGSHFNISPNKTKEYAYNSEGYWEYSWTTSSVVSIDIDGHNIETCGSTVLFADTALKKYDIKIPSEVDLSTDTNSSITVSDEIRYSDMWSLQYWWITDRQSHNDTNAKAVIVQSQNGDPICMYTGNAVSWSVSENLPKTTEICIDGRMLYIHRANFAIIDLNVIE